MYQYIFKRFFDITLSLLLIIPVSLICIIFGFLIKLEDKGPILYCGYRLGRDRTKFPMYKLRSMKLNAPDLRNEDGSTFNSENDPRLLKIGNLIRKTSIDELPQIFNVLLGHMSLVGPRPDLYEQGILYDELNMDIKKFEVKPGITGYAQSNGRNDLLWEDKLKLDRYYVEHYSFILDLKIIFKTIFSVVLKKGINHKEVLDGEE